MPERPAQGASALAVARAGPCGCTRLPGTGGDPDRLTRAGEMLREGRIVHQEPQCTEHVVVCAACGTRYWVIEDNGHWSGPAFTWTSSRPLI
jgi:hypothetical protein